MKQATTNDNIKDNINILNVGIDLGTSRSSISTNNSEKAWLESYVGWPKDFIAEKTLGKEILYGNDALKNRLSVDLYRPLERGVIKEGIERNEEAVAELINHLIELSKPEKGQKINAVVGVPADTLKVNKLAIKRALNGHVNAVMVVSEPFSVAYGLDLLDNAMTIDIGAGTVDFCVMHGTIPTDEDQRTILSAGDSIDQHLFSSLSEKYPDADFTINMVRQFKEKFSFVGTPPAEINVEMPQDGKTVRHNITEEMKQACESILPALIDSTIDMIASSDPEFQTKLKKNIIIAGGGSQIRGLAEYMTQQLKERVGKCNVTCVSEPLYAGSDGSLKLAEDMPAKYWD